MSSIFKYLPHAYAESFVARGEVLFRALSYFRNYEEQQVRGDAFEGARLYQPTEGLHLTKVNTGEKLTINGAFESRVRDRELFVLCLSQTKSDQIAADFGVDACVEIRNKGAFIAAIKAALRRRIAFKDSPVLNGPVGYYQPEAHPKSVWAVPEQIIMQKTAHYENQREYRIAFGAKDAFAVEAVTTSITTTPGQASLLPGMHPEVLLRLGSLRHICTVHRFR